MSRGDRGHPQITLSRVLFADLVLSLAGGTLAALAIVPGSVAQLRDVAWYWEAAAWVAGLVTAAVVVGLALRSAPLFDRQILWMRQTYELAKARPDLSSWKGLSGFAQVIAGTLFCIVIFAAIVPIIPVVAWAFRNFPWMDSWGGATLAFLPFPLWCAALAIGYRFSIYAGFHVARNITGSPPR